ncbi:MAG: alpha/beta hydrolase [Planctomycetes bacterium]|nr:alpha/beta hydrolase [Planctomycetota bacterium]
MAATPGCLSEQSFQVQPANIRQVDTVAGSKTPEPQRTLSARVWATQTQESMRHLLPESSKPALLAENIRDDGGNTINVYDHFGIREDGLRTLLGNLDGITCTAQCASRASYIDTPPPPWDDFADVLVPINDDFSLSGRMGFAKRDGKIIDTDCIVILPGLFGDNGVKRTWDIAAFLKDSGYHVLALEVRAHGQTEARHPEVYHTWGVLESDDLMHVSDWLEAMPKVKRTGLIGYCWGANIAMMSGWYDAAGRESPQFAPRIREELTAIHDRPRYTAGIILFSPILGWERLRDELETPRGALSDPVYNAIQETIRARMVRKGYENPSGSLKDLIEHEFRNCGVPLPNGTADAYAIVRFLPYKNELFYDKLSEVRTPMLFVHGANDPLSPAQEVADLVSTTDNPNVATVILPGGGHVGFAAYAKEYYFNLVANFFDPTNGPSPVPVRTSTLINTPLINTTLINEAGTPVIEASPPPSKNDSSTSDSPAHHASAATACRRQ